MPHICLIMSTMLLLIIIFCVQSSASSASSKIEGAIVSQSKSELLFPRQLANLENYTISSDAVENLSASYVRGLDSIIAWDIVAIAFMSLGLALAAAGGVGGGPIIVPVLVLMLHFDIKHATPLSNVTIIGGAVANAIFNVPKRHPAADRPLIDPDICLAMIPPIIGGAVLGTFFSKLLPGYVISLLFVVVLAVGGIRTLQKGIQLYSKESTMSQEANSSESSQDLTPNLPTAEASGNYCQSSPHSEYRREDQIQQHRTACEEENLVKEAAVGEDLAYCNELVSPCTYGFSGKRCKELNNIYINESKFSGTKHGLVFVCYGGIVAASIAGAVVVCGSIAYWILLGVEIPWVLLFSVISSIYLTRRYTLKIALDYNFADGDVKWTTKAVIWFPSVCGLAGVVAGLFGIGGGIITGPLMIEMGVVPQVASATTALMVLYAAAAATAKFAVFGMVAWDWGAVLCGVAFVVTALAQVYIVRYVRQSGKQSIIVLCIGSSIALGAMLMAYQAIRSTINEAGKPFSIDICSIAPRA